jgi:SpoVK/Ycf46/Vps4 family AAA+-type ATPase
VNNLDPALKRAGRFDHVIEIRLPDEKEVAEIFKIHIENKNHELNE